MARDFNAHVCRNYICLVPILNFSSRTRLTIIYYHLPTPKIIPPTYYHQSSSANYSQTSPANHISPLITFCNGRLSRGNDSPKRIQYHHVRSNIHTISTNHIFSTPPPILPTYYVPFHPNHHPANHIIFPIPPAQSYLRT